jgi:hypothetical protein
VVQTGARTPFSLNDLIDYPFYARIEALAYLRLLSGLGQLNETRLSKAGL